MKILKTILRGWPVPAGVAGVTICLFLLDSIGSYLIQQEWLGECIIILITFITILCMWLWGSSDD